MSQPRSQLGSFHLHHGAGLETGLHPLRTTKKGSKIQRLNYVNSFMNKIKILFEDSFVPFPFWSDGSVKFEMWK